VSCAGNVRVAHKGILLAPGLSWRGLISVSHFTQLFPFSLWPVTTLRNFMFLYPPRRRNGNAFFLCKKEFRRGQALPGPGTPTAAVTPEFLETLAFYVDMNSFKTNLPFFKERDAKVKEND
jgi:hypothetical protein